MSESFLALIFHLESKIQLCKTIVEEHGDFRTEVEIAQTLTKLLSTVSKLLCHIRETKNNYIGQSNREDSTNELDDAALIEKTEDESSS